MFKLGVAFPAYFKICANCSHEDEYLYYLKYRIVVLNEESE